MVKDQLNAATRACRYVLSKWGNRRSSRNNPQGGDDLFTWTLEQCGQARQYENLGRKSGGAVRQSCNKSRYAPPISYFPPDPSLFVCV